MNPMKQIVDLTRNASDPERSISVEMTDEEVASMRAELEVPGPRTSRAVRIGEAILASPSIDQGTKDAIAAALL